MTKPSIAPAIKRLEKAHPHLYAYILALDEQGCLVPLSADKRPLCGYSQDKPLPRLAADCETYAIDLYRAGLAVIDIDVNHADGADGLTTWETLCEGLGKEARAAYRQTTPSGGLHLISLLPRGRGVKSRNDLATVGLAGIDVKGTGEDGTKHALVLGPGSRAHKKVEGAQTKTYGYYEPLEDVEPQDDFPLWFITEVEARFAEQQEEQRLANVQSYGVTDGELTAYKTATLRNICNEMAATRKGAIDSTMNTLLFNLGRSGVDWRHAEGPFFQAAAQAGATPGHIRNPKWKKAWQAGFAKYDPAEDKDSAVSRNLSASPAQRAHSKSPVRIIENDEIQTSQELEDAVYAKYSPNDFFAASKDKDGNEKTTTNLLALTTAEAVVEAGPLLRGKDGLYYRYCDGVYRPSDSVIVERLANLLGDRFRGGFVSSVEPQVARLTDLINAEEPPSEYINFKNGLYRWETGEMEEFSPDIRSTVQLSINWNENAKCPQFEKFLKQVLPEDAIETMWEVIGYSLYSGNPLQTAVMLVGEGGNGKGTLLRVLRGIIGDHNISTVALDEFAEDRFATADLYGKIANIAGDIDSTFQAKTATFKKVTGGDAIRGQRKGKDAFLFQCWAFQLFSANTIPGASDTSDGYFRRWLVFKFPHKVEKKDPWLDAKLAEEYEGIAAKAMPYLVKLLKRQQWTISPSLANAKNEFQRKTDHIRDFLDDVTVAESSMVHCSTPQAVFERYIKWCEENNHPYPLSKRNLYTRVERTGHERKKVKGYERFSNLRLKTEDELVAEAMEALEEAELDEQEAEELARKEPPSLTPDDLDDIIAEMA